MHDVDEDAQHLIYNFFLILGTLDILIGLLIFFGNILCRVCGTFNR